MASEATAVGGSTPAGAVSTTYRTEPSESSTASRLARRLLGGLGSLGLVGLVALAPACGAADKAPVLPAPATDVAAAASGKGGMQTAVFAGGCFWGVEGVFRHVKGVRSAVSGYAGDTGATATYEKVSSGATRHAESVQVVFDPSQVSYGQLLQVFFSVAHDPTEKNRQGPDEGPQYRSAIFYVDAEQKRVAQAYIAQLGQARAFGKPIVTEVVALPEFFAAEPYHQDYMAKHPADPYIVINDAPKVASLRERFPALYRAK